MDRSILQRVVLSLVSVAAASLLVYSATEALPGDAASAALGRQATPEALASLRSEIGLDEPFLTRYASWVSDVVTGDLGTSYSSQRSVWTVIQPALVNSMLLAGVAIVITIPTALFLGLLCGLWRGGWFDGVVGGITLIAVSLPEFLLGLFLAATFGIAWDLLPPTSLFPQGASAGERAQQLVLPAVAVAGVTIGYVLRMTRAATIEVLDSDYVQAARLRGVRGRALVFRHVARNSLIPSVNVIGNQVAWMLGGMIAVELVFSFPGIGMLLVNSVIARDAPLIAGVALIVTTMYILVNLLADLAAIWLNPRLRTARV
jgi:peptide/nickel transport system permease protein